MTLTNAQYRAIVRNDFYTFIERSFRELQPEVQFLPNWHIAVIAHALERCRRGEIRRLIINLPPRSLKSHIVSTAFTAWLHGHDPSAQLICLSYAQDLADQFSRQTRILMKSLFYEGLFPTRLSRHKDSVSEFVTTRGGVRLATSVGGVLTGRGADVMVVDDPQKPDGALSETQRNATNTWFDNTVVSRLNDKRTGCIIVVMQRLNEDDLTGHLLSQGGWELLRLPAIAEEDEKFSLVDPYGRPISVGRRAGEPLHVEREPLSVLDKLREELGSFNFAGQYQQSPMPLEGGLVKVGWFKTYTEAMRLAGFEMIFQSWDTASKTSELNDYSVCTTWGKKGKDLYLLHVLRKRLEYPDLKRTVVRHAQDFGAATVIIEDAASGIQLIQDLVRDGFHSVKRYKSMHDKGMRMLSVTPTIENGFVFLPEKAEWLAPYVHEMTTFPNGKFDDQVDSTSQALDWTKSGMQIYGLLEYHKMMTSPLGISLLGPTSFR